jgi:two-component system, NarL family, response regulator NreC
MTPRVLLADDHVIVREGLRALLAGRGFEIVAEASDGYEAVQLAKKLQPHVAVLDLAMPLLNGVEAAREIHRVCSGTRTLLLTMHSEDRYVLQALQAGIKGFVIKTRAADELARAIEEVMRGETYLSPRASRAVVEAYLTRGEPPADPLTPRERQILQLIGEGKTSKAIAGLLDISVKTAESHRASIMAKLDVHHVAGLVHYAIRQGLIQL